MMPATGQIIRKTVKFVFLFQILRRVLVMCRGILKIQVEEIRLIYRLGIYRRVFLSSVKEAKEMDGGGLL